MRNVIIAIATLSLLISPIHQPAAGINEPAIITIRNPTDKSNIEVVTIEIGSSKASVSGKPIILSNPVVMNSGMSFIAISDLDKLVPGKHTWQVKEGLGTFHDDLTNTTVSYKLASKTSTVDGDTVNLKAAPYVKSNAFMIPLRAILSEFGYAFASNGKKLTISRQNSLEMVSWHGPGIDGAKTSSVPNGHAPKSGKFKAGYSKSKGYEDLYPLIYGDRLLFANQHEKKNWICYDTEKFNQMWQADPKYVWYDRLMSQMAYDDGMVFSGSGPTCINAQNGKTLWQQNITNGDCYAAFGKVIAFKSVDANKDKLYESIDLCCFDGKTGKLIFMVPMKNMDRLPYLRSSKFAFSQNNLFFEGKCIRLSDGKVLFDVSPSTDNPLKGAIATTNGNFIYWDNQFLRLADSNTGKTIYEWKMPRIAGCAYQNGKIYVSAGHDNSLKRIDEKSGIIEDFEPAMVGGIVVSGHLIYIYTTERAKSVLMEPTAC